MHTILCLHRQCPFLWDDFGRVGECVELMGREPVLYRRLYKKLIDLNWSIERHFSATDRRLKDVLARFAAATGFVERSVTVLRRLMREQGKTYVTGLPPLSDVRNANEGCVVILRLLFLNCTALCGEFSLSLARSGFLQDLQQDLKHIRHMSAKHLVSFYTISLALLSVCLSVSPSPLSLSPLSLFPVAISFSLSLSAFSV